MTAPPAGALEACEQRALDGLLANLEHEAGDVEDSAPSIDEDEDAYWAYQSYHAIRSLQRALLAALRLREWRPIAEAPAEGEFLVYMPGERMKMQVAKWHPNVKVIGSAFAFDLTKPPHWMPLPAPPTADDLASVLEEG